jgi:serine/threonine protein kinase
LLIQELHGHRIVHRDLKAENILSHNGIYKIADLGFSKEIDPVNELQQTTLGTITTMAPEVMKKEAYGLKVMLWLCRLISGRLA